MEGKGRENNLVGKEGSSVMRGTGRDGVLHSEYWLLRDRKRGTDGIYDSVEDQRRVQARRGGRDGIRSRTGYLSERTRPVSYGCFKRRASRGANYSPKAGMPRSLHPIIISRFP